jgi:biotin transport system substrate-specific component
MSTSSTITARTLVDAIAPDRSTTVDALLVVSAATLTALAAQVSIPLPWTPVPFTLQPMAVLLTAAALGWRRGALAQLLYLTAGLSGLPVFAPSPLLPPGPARLIGPTGGYLLAYVPAALLVGFLAERRLDRSRISAALAMTAGLAVIYLGGAGWLALISGKSLREAAALGVAPFLWGDLIKVILAAIGLPAIWKWIGRAHDAASPQ